jgi:hypothetical protein
MQNVGTGCIRGPELSLGPPDDGVSLARDRVMTLSHSSRLDNEETQCMTHIADDTVSARHFSSQLTITNTCCWLKVRKSIPAPKITAF